MRQSVDDLYLHAGIRTRKVILKVDVSSSSAIKEKGDATFCYKLSNGNRAGKKHKPGALNRKVVFELIKVVVPIKGGLLQVRIVTALAVLEKNEKLQMSNTTMYFGCSTFRFFKSLLELVTSQHSGIPVDCVF